MDHSRQEKVPESSVIDNAAAGTGRSYECNFCKRGFTNAQALGGHMNIHRKEKAKASKQSHDVFHRRSFSNPFFRDDQEASNKCGEADFTHHFNLPVPNPSPFLSASSNNLGSNLSLDMGSWRGPKHDEIGARGDEKMENEVDLELRLGQDPNRPNN